MNNFTRDLSKGSGNYCPHRVTDRKIPRVEKYRFLRCIGNTGIELTAKTVDEDPDSYKHWISREEI